MEEYLKVIFQEIAEEKGFEVTIMEVGEEDHIHVFASAHPKISRSYIIKMLKGISGRKLFLKFPEIKQKLFKGKLWNSSFYLETVGSISEDVDSFGKLLFITQNDFSLKPMSKSSIFFFQIIQANKKMISAAKEHIKIYIYIPPSKILEYLFKQRTI